MEINNILEDALSPKLSLTVVLCMEFPLVVEEASCIAFLLAQISKLSWKD